MTWAYRPLATQLAIDAYRDEFLQHLIRTARIDIAYAGSAAEWYAQNNPELHHDLPDRLRAEILRLKGLNKQPTEESLK